jgi:hypothetical protein
LAALAATGVPWSKRTSAYGVFTAGYGLALFLGSVVIGLLYAVGVPLLVVFGIIAELAAVPVLLWVARRRP